MPIEQCRQIITLHRLRNRVAKRIETYRDAGDDAVVEFYSILEEWLDRQLSQTVASAE